MHQIAEDEKDEFPLVQSVLKHEIYVDDIQTGGHTIDKTLEIRNHVIGALKSAGMELRKWASNDHRILDGIPPEHQSNSQSLSLHNQDTIKILGMCWIPNNDCFKLQLKFKLPTEITKRSILSTIARLYDPLGYISPIIIAAKIILKKVWAAGIVEWNQPTPSEITTQWQQFASALPSIDKIVVPRWINYEPGNVKSIQLHVFCDGSSSAYAAAAYIRINCHNGDIHTHLIASKSKVTPTKPLTIPQTELNGAELAVRLASWVTKQLRIKIDSTHFWSDATIVLYWIHGDVNRWKTFVANRIAKILRASQPHQWNHIGTKENPADCATRGLTPDQLETFDLWWHGSPLLSQAESTWQKFNVCTAAIDESSAEIKMPKVHIHFNIPQESIIFKYSSYQRLVRVNAWIWRFKENCLAKREQRSRRSGQLVVSELHHSLLKIVRLVQQETFGSELSLISSNEQLPNKSKISGLAPFIENDLLRVRGRLQRSNLSYQQKHPIILPSSHPSTKLLIEDSHIRTLHGGAQLVLSHTRQQFWIVDGRRTIQLQLRKCVKCFKRKPELSSQLMGNLPYHRVNPPQRPFLATGIDYTGAFEVKASRFRGNTTYKAYIAIFICLATKAVHLEAVTGMTTKHFLWALHRFTGRRGVCHDIYSDNGTNFIGAEKKLKENIVPFATGVENDIIPELCKQGIQWHFNPPHSPNFGGLWESNIRSMKYHLYRVLDNSHLTYEELTTVLVRIESMFNSRPLCPLTMDPDDLNILTPGQFLIGAPLSSLPETPDLSIALCENFVAMQRMMQQFWQKWSSDWLSHLQNRPKRHKIQPNLQINDIVIIKDDRLKPNEWLIGRIIEVHPGADNLVRVATIRTSKGAYKRSVSKLCRLPITNDLSSSSSEEQQQQQEQ